MEVTAAVPGGHLSSLSVGDAVASTVTVTVASTVTAAGAQLRPQQSSPGCRPIRFRCRTVKGGARTADNRCMIRWPTRRRPAPAYVADDAYDFAVLNAMEQTSAIVPPRLRGQFISRYVCALLAVALLATTAFVITSRLVDNQASAAAQVNTAGRQRMLSQRIALQAGLLARADGAARDALRATLSADLDSLASGQRGLLLGDPARNLPGHPSASVNTLYRGGTEAAVEGYVATGRSLLKVPEPGPLPDDPAIRALQAQALGPLLAALDAVVQAYQRDSERRISTILREEQVILALTLLTLVAEALVVFRPMSRRIEHETQRLEEASARHRAEAARHAFSLQLRDAVDLTDNEPDLVATVLQAVDAGGVPGSPELLLTQEGQGLLPIAGLQANSCSVGTADGCPALRRGRTMSFPSSHELGACIHLRRDAAAAGDERVSSVCVPVTFLGTGLGVLRTVTQVGQPVGERARDALETVASTAGTHVGTLRAFARSRSDAERDPMTGLLNRRGLEQAVTRLEAQRLQFVVVAIDLDHFKSVNDTFGHDAGDTVLVESARTMNSVLRPGDLLARHGGEEFVVVLPLTGEGVSEGDGLAAGMAVAERIRLALAASHQRGEGPSCTASLGVAGPVSSDLNAALRRADAALYRAKSSGRNCVEVAGDLVGNVPSELSAV